MDGVLLSQAAKIIHTKSSSKIKSLTRTSKKAANEDNHLSGSTAAMVLFHLDQIYIAWLVIHESLLLLMMKNQM